MDKANRMLRAELHSFFIPFLIYLSLLPYRQKNAIINCDTILITLMIALYTKTYNTVFFNN